MTPATQSKLSRVSSGFGLSKLTGVRRNKKENSLNKNSPSAQVRSQTACDVPSVRLCVWCVRGSIMGHISFWLSARCHVLCNRQETFQWMFTHIAVVRDLVAMQYKEYQEVPLGSCPGRKNVPL